MATQYVGISLALFGIALFAPLPLWFRGACYAGGMTFAVIALALLTERRHATHKAPPRQ